MARPDKSELPTSLRIPVRLLDRAEALASAIGRTTGVPVARSGVLLAAIEAGLAVLEARPGAGAPPPPTAPTRGRRRQGG